MIVVRNMPGAGGVIAPNYVYSAKPDGHTVLASTGGVQLAQLVGIGGVRYDFNKMTCLIASPSSNTFFMRSGIIDKPEDILKAKGLVFGGSTGGGAYFTVFAKEILDFPTEKVVLAYSGSGDVTRAFLSREINLASNGTTAYLQSIFPYVAKGEVMPLFGVGVLDAKGDVVREHLVPDLLTMKELYENLYDKSPSGTAWDAFKAVLASRSYTKSLFLPPGTQESIVRVYWAASEAMVKDPEFRKAYQSIAGEGARLIVGENIDKEFKLNFHMDPKAVEWLRAALAKYGMVVE